MWWTCSSVFCVYFLFERSKSTIDLYINIDYGVMWLLVAWGSRSCGLKIHKCLWPQLNYFNKMCLSVFLFIPLCLSGRWPLTVQCSAIAGHRSRCHSSWKFKGQTLTSQETWKTDARSVRHTHTDTHTNCSTGGQSEVIRHYNWACLRPGGKSTHIQVCEPSYQSGPKIDFKGFSQTEAVLLFT